MDATASTLIPANRRQSLTAWFELYMAIEAGPKDGNTFKAKKRDLQEFLNYLTAAAGTGGQGHRHRPRGGSEGQASLGRAAGRVR